MRDTNDKPLLAAIAGLSLPACLSFLLQNAYHVNDAWFLGRVGAEASNALGLFMMVMIGNFGFIFMMARGTQSLVGRRLGAGRPQAAYEVLARGLGLALCMLVPLGMIEWAGAESILTVMGGSGETVESGARYLRTVFLFMPFLFAAPIIEFSFQAMGDTKTPFKLQLVAVSLNIALNWLLVLPHETWGLPGWGVAGAAFATGCSRMLSSVLGFWIMVRRSRSRVLLTAASYRPLRSVSAEIVRVGVPAGSSTLLFAVVSAVVLRIIGHVGGQDAFGAYGIAFRGVESLSFMVVLGIGVGAGTVASHATGAGLMDRARRAGHVGVGLGVAAMSVTTVLFLFWSRELVGIYLDVPAQVTIAAGYVAVMAWCQVPQALEMIYAEAMAGAGSSLRTAVISIPGNALRIPLAWLLASSLGYGLQGVWWAIVISAVVKGAGVSWLYASGRWMGAVLAGRQVVEEA